MTSKVIVSLIIFHSIAEGKQRSKVVILKKMLCSNKHSSCLSHPTYRLHRQPYSEKSEDVKIRKKVEDLQEERIVLRNLSCFCIAASAYDMNCVKNYKKLIFCQMSVNFTKTREDLDSPAN